MPNTQTLTKEVVHHSAKYIETTKHVGMHMHTLKRKFINSETYSVVHYWNKGLQDLCHIEFDVRYPVRIWESK